MEFYLEDLSIFDSGVLKSSTIIVLLSISFLKSSKIFFMYFGAPMLGAYIFTMFMSSWWILPLNIMKWPSGSLFMALLLKFLLSDMIIATPAFFSHPFAWNICFQPFFFSLCRSFVPRWVSYRHHICGSYFLIHSATMCLLIGAFSLFTFKVTIDRYLLIAILFPLYLCFSLFLFSFLPL